MDLSLLPAPGPGKLVVVPGWRDVGKTTFCQRAAETYRAAGLTVSGLLSPGRFEQGKKNGFFALILHSGEIRLAASLAAGELTGLTLGSWVFDARVFAWGNPCLREIRLTDVLMIDERGPLEFNRQTGGVASFELLRQKNFGLALVVIRPECLDDFSALGFAYGTREIRPPG